MRWATRSSASKAPGSRRHAKPGRACCSTVTVRTVATPASRRRTSHKHMALRTARVLFLARSAGNPARPEPLHGVAQLDATSGTVQRWMRMSMAWPATTRENACRDCHHRGGIGRVDAGRGRICCSGAPRCRPPAQPAHIAPRPHRSRPSVRWMNSTSTDRGWKEKALPAASASMGDAPGAKLNRKVAQPPGKV
jgi:hypothetical protein